MTPTHLGIPLGHGLRCGVAAPGTRCWTGRRHPATLPLMAAPNVLLVEDDDLTRTSLALALRSLGVNVVGAVGTASSAMDVARKNTVDVVIADLHLGVGPTGIDVAHALRRENPFIGVVLLTTYADPRLLDPDLPMIPDGTLYLVKSSVRDPAVLADAVRASRQGRVTRAPALDLTNQQIEVLRLIASGLSNAQIAAARGVSDKAIEQMVSRLIKRLQITDATGPNSRIQLTRAYLRLTGNPHEEPGRDGLR